MKTDARAATPDAGENAERPRYAIECRDVGIEFVINRRHKARLRDYVIQGRRATSERFWALRHIDLNIAPGDSVGLIGANGSGKSTLLKIIAGVLRPDEGEVIVHGGMAPLIELGAGFSGDLSARENVYLSGMILGLQEREIDEKFEDIVRFAGVRKFLDTPLKHFSSGMKARLGFAIVAQIDYPIMLIDEVLAVGDKAFRRKCNDVLDAKLGRGGRTLVLVSHREGDIRRFCRRVVYLRGGVIVADGEPDEVLARYNRDAEAD